MRKATIVTLLLFVLTVGGAVIMAVGTYATHDQVVLTEKTVYGDLSAADGLTVELRALYDNKLFWNTTYTTGEHPTTETEYAFSAQGRSENHARVYGGVQLWTNALLGVDPSDDVLPTGLEIAYQELLEETPVGEEGSRIVYLKNYLDYYPLEVTIGLPEADVNLQEWQITNDENGTIPGTAAYVVTKLREYFRIPVMEDEMYEIHVSRHAKQGMYGWGGGSASTESNDFYHMSTFNTMTDDACYFTFITRTRDGKVVDTSQLPDGYGIYRLPYQASYRDENGEEICGVGVDALEMIYPLDPAVELVELDISCDQKELMLYTVEDGKYILTVIDLETLETQQKLEIAEFQGGWKLYNEGDFLAISLGGEKLALIDRNETGDYVLRHLWDVKPEGVEYIPTYDAYLDYDGERLVLAGPLPDREFYDEYYKREEVCGFLLAVYEDDGLAYCGEYRSSLNTGRDLEHIGYYCRNTGYNSLTATWN